MQFINQVDVDVDTSEMFLENILPTNDHQEDFSSILDSMNNFEEDIADLLFKSSLLDNEEDSHSQQKLLLTEEQMTQIIRELLEEDRETLIANGEGIDSQAHELDLIEETLKCMELSCIWIICSSSRVATKIFWWFLFKEVKEYNIEGRKRQAPIWGK